MSQLMIFFKLETRDRTRLKIEKNLLSTSSLVNKNNKVNGNLLQ